MTDTPPDATPRAVPPNPVESALFGHPAPPVNIVQRTGFFRLVFASILALCLLGGVFLLGIGTGVIGVGVLGVWIGGSLDQSVVESTWRKGSGGGRIAIIPVLGVIDARQSAFIEACVRNVLEDSSVRAVVLRVDSPGGGVTPSDQIWHGVERLRQSGLPVVASYGGIAASGGYYVSCSSDFIMAEETTVTGSIGVIAQVMTFEGLFEKVGISPVTLVATGSPEKSVANDVFRDWTDADRRQVTRILDSAYDVFHARVVAGRADAFEGDAEVDAVATGAVFTASEAVTNGLIDGTGYLEDAVAKAEQLAGLATGGAVVRLSRPPSLFGPVGALQGATPERTATLDADSVRSFVNDLGTVRLMYLMW